MAYHGMVCRQCNLQNHMLCLQFACMILCLHDMAQPMYSFLTVKQLLRTASAAMTVRHTFLQELIGTLEEAKSKAVEITQKLAEASATASQIEEVRARYKPAALRGAVLFFVLASLAAISNMYEYSLASFLAVFSLTLDTSKKVGLSPNNDVPCNPQCAAEQFQSSCYNRTGVSWHVELYQN